LRGNDRGCRKHSLTADNGNVLQIVQYACRIKDGGVQKQFRQPTNQQALKFIATNAADKTQRQWTAYCGITPANAKSSCIVHEDLGTGVPKTSLVCSEYRKFVLAQ
jgi:hypothetical protein